MPVKRSPKALQFALEAIDFKLAADRRRAGGRQEPSGKYGGLSFVVFPRTNGPSLIGWVVGTQSLEPDQDVLSRPGNARKAQAIARWLNRKAGQRVAWAKGDPTQVDESVRIPKDVVQELQDFGEVFDKYGPSQSGHQLPRLDEGL